MKQIIKSLLINIIAIVIGTSLAVAGSQKGVLGFRDIPLFAFGVILAFAINWIAFIPAFIFQTEKFFDLTGSLSYISVIVSCFLLSQNMDIRSYIALSLVLIWAIRLGAFLFKRILKDGHDSRFDDLKTNFFRFLTVWTLQGLWVTMTLATALVIITTPVNKPFNTISFIGTIIWLIGFIIEVIADAQKSTWRKNSQNKGKFIDIGLWSKSRHPNYFGEILIWIGMAVIALPVLNEWQFVSLISPLFVIILLTKISGLPILEKRADAKWGGMANYEQYKKQTPVLIPKIWTFRTRDNR